MTARGGKVGAYVEPNGSERNIKIAQLKRQVYGNDAIFVA
jgi:hypothetical protein